MPTVFILALSQTGTPLNVGLAWGYVILRILHSLVQVTFNRVALRFALFCAVDTMSSSAFGKRHLGDHLIRRLLAGSGHVEVPRLRAEQRTVGVASKLLLASGSGTQCQRVAQQPPPPPSRPPPLFLS